MNGQKIRGAAAALLAGLLLLSGCSRTGLLQSKPTAVSLSKDAVQNVQKAESAAVHMDLDSEIAVKYAALNIGMDIGLDVGMDMEMTKSPQRARGTADVKTSAVGQTETLTCDFYLDMGEDADTTYLRFDDGSWSKKTMAKGGEPNALSITQAAGLLKAIAEEAMTAELQEETVTVNGRDAYQISCTLTGDQLKSFMEAFGQGTASAGAAGGSSGGAAGSSGGSPAGNGETAGESSGSGGNTGIDLTSVDWSSVEIPAEIYVYEESRLPARINMDCRTVGEELFSGILGEALKDLPAGLPADSIRMEVSACTVDLTFDRYGEIDAIEIPQEALDAKETDDLKPGLTDLFGI